MRHRYRDVAAATLIAAALASCLRAADATGVGPLFDGRSFTGWNGDTARTWRIEDGAIVAGDPARAAPRNEFLATDREFGDFELRYEYRIDAAENPNAGVQFRSRRIPDHHEVIGYQADIGSGINGALYDESRRRTFLAIPPKEVQERALAASRNGWNACVIRCSGLRVRIAINGVETVDYTEPDAAVERRGVIALQIHGGMVGTIRYRSISITESPASENTR